MSDANAAEIDVLLFKKGDLFRSEFSECRVRRYRGARLFVRDDRSVEHFFFDIAYRIFA